MDALGGSGYEIGGSGIDWCELLDGDEEGKGQLVETHEKGKKERLSLSGR